MTQATDWGVPQEADRPITPAVYTARDQASFDALLSCHRGVARPPYAATGTFWIKDTGSSPAVDEVYIFDGTNDVLIGSIDLVGGVFSPSIANGSLALAKLTDATEAGYMGAAGAGPMSFRTLAQLRQDVLSDALATGTPETTDLIAFLESNGDSPETFTARRATIQALLDLASAEGLSETVQQTFSSESSWTLSVPVGAKRVLISWGHVTKSAHSTAYLRLGGAGGIKTANYYAYAHGGHWDPGGGQKNRLDSDRTTSHFWGSGDNPLYYASGWNTGIVELYHAGGNVWVCKTAFYSDANNDHGYGHKIGHLSVGEELTDVEISLASGVLNGGNIRAWVE